MPTALSPGHAQVDSQGKASNASIEKSSGWAVLEQLAYNKDRTVDYIQAAREQSSALQRLAKHFNLRPWQRVGDHLAALKLAHPLGPACT